MNLSGLVVGQQLIVQVIWGERKIEFYSYVVAPTPNGLYITPYMHNNSPLDLKIDTSGKVQCNVFAASPEDGHRISWESVELHTVKRQGSVLRQMQNSPGVTSAVHSSPVAFKGNLNITKHFWRYFRNLSDYMKEASEMTNAVIAMIGTGIIAPFAIMCSPKKKCNQTQNVNTENAQKIDKEKKFFQAIRQPVSAVLAFGFQVPTTLGIEKLLNMAAYKWHAPIFADEVLKGLIPDKKYLKKEAEKIVEGKAKSKVLENWKQEIPIIQDKTALKTELMDKIRRDYQEVGIEIDDKSLEQMASSKRKISKFLTEKMANAKHERLLNEKVQELAHEHFDIKEVDLVTEDYQNLAKLRYKDDIKALRKDAKLNWFDKFLQSMGLSNKKLTQLSKAEENLAKEKGLELMKKDMPTVFADGAARMRKFVENTNISAQKLYKNKIFWITLATNAVMVGISCVALNWLHPKLANVIDKIRGKKPDDPQTPKVEVKA